MDAIYQKTEFYVLSVSLRRISVEQSRRVDLHATQPQKKNLPSPSHCGIRSFLLQINNQSADEHKSQGEYQTQQKRLENKGIDPNFKSH